METSLYHDELAHDTVRKLKRNMTLDFTGPSSKKQKVATNLLSSPDLNMLKLASPELERMIISQNGMVTTTPTPTQFLCPTNVTEEQEAYARGFVDALNQLHEKEGPPPPPGTQGQAPEPEFVSTSASHPMPATVTNVTALSSVAIPSSTVTSQPFTTTTSLPGSVINNASAAYSNITSTTHIPQIQNPRVVQIKEEPPQTVPCFSNSMSPPLSPIDMESQERIKLDRKRERNRVAARKCRTRKLERISRLEERVSQLKGQNTQLTTTAQELRDQVCKLKEQIMTHVNSGCHVMLAQNVL